MTKLKDISLKDLGMKGKLEKNILEKLVISEPAIDFDAEYSPSLANKFSLRKEKSKPYFEWEERLINNSRNMNSKFLPHINFIENIKNKPGQYREQQDQWEKELEPAEFIPPSKPAEKIIPLTFRKFFSQIFPQNITDFAVKNSEKLPDLVAKIRNDIQKDAQNWLDFVSDKQINALLCQTENYSPKGKTYKKPSEFQNIPQVIQWILDTNLKLAYESADWNRDQVKTFSKEKGNLLIIDISLFQSLEIAEKWENRQESEKRKIPLPLHQVWSQFASVITFPLKNGFQFIILDKGALRGWKDFQKLEVKYDETNSTTYFCRKMEGGFKLLTHYNAVAFIHE
ncbi:MAG: hypothetical protein I3273_02330 [Candidatus Moeniiplasma glomeromycotorum]|nr:hypothetical protein [Candidatus Moeniiplasma glomeromycotorum]MCE8167046.1 hypothetical protein [Candidatus Moeniiplasma glomeromycotorum]MCE8168942.1 hypothetical protein [Candidatus Moeniiplasma glomeromycotorum]